MRYLRTTFLALFGLSLTLAGQEALVHPSEIMRQLRSSTKPAPEAREEVFTAHSPRLPIGPAAEGGYVELVRILYHDTHSPGPDAGDRLDIEVETGNIKSMIAHLYRISLRQDGSYNARLVGRDGGEYRPNPQHLAAVLRITHNYLATRAPASKK